MKIRVWTCPCCHRQFKRFKSDRIRPICELCNVSMVSGRTLLKSKNCKHIRVKDKRLDFYDSYCTKIRKTSGKVYRPTREIKKLWRMLDHAKRQDSFIRRAQGFVNQLSRDIEARNEKGWSRQLNNNGTINKWRSNLVIPPRIVFESLPFGNSYKLYGDYNRKECKIRLNSSQGLFEAKKTLLHEIIHFIDSFTGTRVSDHDKYFYTRLALLESMFPIKD